MLAAETASCHRRNKKRYFLVPVFVRDGWDERLCFQAIRPLTAVPPPQKTAEDWREGENKFIFSSRATEQKSQQCIFANCYWSHRPGSTEPVAS